MRPSRSFSRILFLQSISGNEDFQSTFAQFPLRGQPRHDALSRLETPSTVGCVHKIGFLQPPDFIGRSRWLWDLRMSYLHTTTQHYHSPTIGLGYLEKWSQPRFRYCNSFRLPSQIPFDHSLHLSDNLDHSSNWRSPGNFWTCTHSETYFETYFAHSHEILETPFSSRLAAISPSSQRPSTTFLVSYTLAADLWFQNVKKKHSHADFWPAKLTLSFLVHVAGAKLRTPKELCFCLSFCCLRLLLFFRTNIKSVPRSTAFP